jgi:hypothetical protein
MASSKEEILARHARMAANGESPKLATPQAAPPAQHAKLAPPAGAPHTYGQYEAPVATPMAQPSAPPAVVQPQAAPAMQNASQSAVTRDAIVTISISGMDHELVSRVLAWVRSMEGYAIDDASPQVDTRRNVGALQVRYASFVYHV